MQKDSAKTVADLVLQASGLLDESVRVVAGSADPTSLARHRDAVSRAMIVLLVDVLNPIFAEHPDLTPPGWFGPP